MMYPMTDTPEQVLADLHLFTQCKAGSDCCSHVPPHYGWGQGRAGSRAPATHAGKKQNNGFGEILVLEVKSSATPQVLAGGDSSAGQNVASGSRAGRSPCAAVPSPQQWPYLGDNDLPGAGAQLVDLCLGDVGAFLGVVQLVLHLAVLHQVGVGLLLLESHGQGEGTARTSPHPPHNLCPSQPPAAALGKASAVPCPRRAQWGRALTASSNCRL